MRRGWPRVLSDPLLAGIGLGFVVFGCWQVLNHYLLMGYLVGRLGMSMLFYHYFSFLAEMLFAAFIALFASHALRMKNRQLEQLHRQKDLLTNALVHDLRQPLSAVMGGLASISHEVGLPNGTKDLVDIAYAGADELLGMVNDLLDIGRAEAGRPLLALSPMDLLEAIRAGVNSVAELARVHHLELTLDLPDSFPQVHGDAERLRRVVMNLVGNAVKFTPEYGRVSVSARTHGEEIWVQVADTGPGIPEDLRHDIFDKFSVLRPASGSRTSTGLGLTFCKLIVEAHGGRIWVEEAPEGGSVFTFALPLLAPGTLTAAQLPLWSAEEDTAPARS